MSDWKNEYINFIEEIQKLQQTIENQQAIIEEAGELLRKCGCNPFNGDRASITIHNFLEKIKRDKG